MLGNELLLYTVNELPLGAGVQVVQQPLILLLQIIMIKITVLDPISILPSVRYRRYSTGVKAFITSDILNN